MSKIEKTEKPKLAKCPPSAFRREVIPELEQLNAIVVPKEENIIVYEFNSLEDRDEYYDTQRLDGQSFYKAHFAIMEDGSVYDIFMEECPRREGKKKCICRKLIKGLEDDDLIKYKKLTRGIPRT